MKVKMCVFVSTGEGEEQREKRKQTAQREQSARG